MEESDISSFGANRSLLISIVSYAPELETLRETLACLQIAVSVAKKVDAISHARLVIVDNGLDDSYRRKMEALTANWPGGDAYVINSPRNEGFGAGHNLAAEESEQTYLLVLNPDVAVSENAILEGVRYLDSNHETAWVSPMAHWPNGDRQYLCKRYPSILDLLLRGYATTTVRNRFKTRMNAYDLVGITEARPVQDIPLASGCFMLFRKAAFDAVSGFSPAYFLYFEDLDMSIRVHKAGWSIAYVPSVKIIHRGGRAAMKGWKHQLMFIKSALVFFKQYGWRLV